METINYSNYSTKRMLAERGPIHKKPKPDQVAQQYVDLLNQGITEQKPAITAPSGFPQEYFNGILSKYGPSGLRNALRFQINLLNGNGQNEVRRSNVYSEFANGVQVYAHMLGQGESAQQYHLMAASLHMRAAVESGGVSPENAQAVFACLDMVKLEMIPPYLQPVLTKLPR